MNKQDEIIHYLIHFTVSFVYYIFFSEKYVDILDDYIRLSILNMENDILI